MYRDLGFLRVWGVRHGRRAAHGERAVRLSDLPAQADRRLRAADAARCSTSTASRFPTASGRTAARGCPTPTTCSPSGWRSTADERRLIATRTCISRAASSTPTRCGATSRRLGSLGARAPRERGARRDAGQRAAPRERRHDRPFDLKHRSRQLTDGPERAPARAYLKGIGYDDEALAKPLVGVAHSWIETMPCNFHLRGSPRRSRRASARPAARRWSSTRSRSPTGSRWAPQG